VQAHCALTGADGRGDKPNPAVLTTRWADFDIDCEPPAVRDGICAQPLHPGPRFLAIRCYCDIAANAAASRKAEKVVNAPRPNQRIVAQITFPTAGVMRT